MFASFCVSESVSFFNIDINFIIRQYMHKTKTRRSPGTKILGVPGIKEIKMT